MSTLRKHWIGQTATVLVLLLGSPVAVVAEAARIALVIGNDTYASTAFDNLDRSPTLDARAMASKLQGLGFEVINPAGDGEPVLDADLDQLEAALERFASRLADRPGALALVYYSGHGVTAKAERNAPDLTYLVPVRTRLTFEHEARSKAISLDEIVDELRALEVGTGVIIFDACRNTALKSHFRSGNLTRGARLPSAEPPDGGLLVAFSTAAGEVAANRPGKMSIYTEALVRHLGTPGLDLAQTFVRVNGEVMRQIGQEPALRADIRRSIPVLVAGDAALNPQILPPVTSQGSVKITASPVDAKILIDGAYVGTGTVVVPDLVGGNTIIVRADKEGFVAQEQKVRVLTGQELSISLILKQGESKPAAQSGAHSATLSPASAILEKAAYQAAFDSMKVRSFDRAIEQFGRLIADYPNGEMTPGAWYWLGELYLAKDELRQSQGAFGEVVRSHPTHAKVPDAIYKLGVVFDRLGDRSMALEYLSRVQTQHPNSAAAGLAKSYASQLR